MSFFLAQCHSQTQWTQFGLIDDNNTNCGPAYISDTDPASWIGVVNNSEAKLLHYYAIDKCIRFYKPNTHLQLESTCDSALIDGNTLYFIELKERCSSGWLAKASDQILNTMRLYKANDPHANQFQLVGQVCNSLKPKASSGHMNVIRKFHSQSGCKLIVQKNIEIS
ncbi:hypothetical protein [Rheinheimera sp. EpRS3]|uniref:hypothetical protein n=1 Tax=Rheinheimera sp. EpRS3 TaxID=1712383 RepID=UPI000749A4DB|nr:hypothetical protein [Rheinheimera sp. EpRS3]KUM53299.1 hypothetical protein AR688_05100 [Rheinheimera sp. EpRS3]